MPASEKTKVVKLERGRHSATFQLIRASLSAASALLATDPARAKGYINDAIGELVRMRADLGGA